MLETCKTLIANQFEAALCTLSKCIDFCPESNWNAPVGNYLFSQVVFHTLFYADYYLGVSDDDFRRQPFHREHVDFFRCYEEFEDHEPTLLYDRAGIKTYFAHCRSKASLTIAA